MFSSRSIPGSGFLALAWSMLSAAWLGALEFPPEFGHKTPTNRVEAQYKPVHEEDFGSGDAFVPEDGVLVADGPFTGRALYLPGREQPYVVEVPPGVMEPGHAYLVQFSYAFQGEPEPDQAILVGLAWDGYHPPEDALSGPRANLWPLRGTHQHAWLVDGDSTGLRLVFEIRAHGAFIDDLHILRLDTRTRPARPRLHRIGFPRLANFHATATSTSAFFNEVPHSEVVEALALHDLVNGLTLDPYGWNIDYFRLKERNPDILLLPYFNAFSAAFDPGGGAVGSSAAGLINRFNEGLQPDWFMVDEDGERLSALAFPSTFQMDHTSHGIAVEGTTYLDYVSRFLANSVMGSGLWDGIHFDQAEWHVNPLLGNPDPFLNKEFFVPPIDFDRDGVAEEKAEIFAEWEAAFRRYFERMSDELGPDTLLLGNAGETPGARTYLERLHGFQFEFFSPYLRLENGDWDTAGASHWHRYLELSRSASRWLRAPQVLATQMTGYGLGTPNGRVTRYNGLEDREPVLEERDFRRMRFGLTGCLMNNGFFGYDFVDNSTAPTAWFDEYAVDLASGRPAKSLAGRGYLGQPLGEAEELPHEQELVLKVSFDTALAGYSAQGLDFSPQVLLSTDPELAFPGEPTGVVHYEPAAGESIEGRVLFGTDAARLPLEAGATYQAYLDFELLDYRPRNFEKILSLGFLDPDDPASLTRFNTATYWDRDAEIGHRGTLRASFRMPNDRHILIGSLSDAASLLIDNLQLVKSTGGVFRRDFENGIVLVNPTPEECSLSQAAIEGALGRTGIRRIDGGQVPAWNDGSPVFDGLTIPSGDGIVLLADHLKAPAPSRPEGIAVTVDGDRASLSWDEAQGTVAGYLVRHGLAGGLADRHEGVGLATECVVAGLEPGRSHFFQIAAFDFLGGISPFSEPVFATRPGTAPFPRTVRNRPLFEAGGAFLLKGLMLDPLHEFVVRVNGQSTPASLLADGSVYVQAPANLSGGEAVVEVIVDGVRTPAIRLPVRAGEVTGFRIEATATGSLGLRWNGEVGTSYEIERSFDLAEWQPVGETTALWPAHQVALSNAASGDSAFFRVRPLPPDSAVEEAARPFRMASPVSPAIEVQDPADLAVLRLDRGVPWTIARNSSDPLDYPAALRSLWDELEAAIAPQQKRYVITSPAGAEGLAPEWDGETTQAPVAPWNGLAFDHPDVVTAYTNHLRAIVRRFEPDYLCVGFEANALLPQMPHRWTNYAQLHRTVSAALIDEFPDLRIVVSIQNEHLTGRHPAARRFLEAFDLEASVLSDVVHELAEHGDLLAIRTIPGLGNGIDVDRAVAIARTAGIVPAFGELALNSAPETLSLASGEVAIDGSPELQAERLERAFQVARRERFAFVAGAARDDAGSFGWRTPTGVPKQAFAVWERQHFLPFSGSDY